MQSFVIDHPDNQVACIESGGVDAVLEFMDKLFPLAADGSTSAATDKTMNDHASTNHIDEDTYAAFGSCATILAECAPYVLDALKEEGEASAYIEKMTLVLRHLHRMTGDGSQFGVGTKGEMEQLALRALVKLKAHY